MNIVGGIILLHDSQQIKNYKHTQTLCAEHNSPIKTFNTRHLSTEVSVSSTYCYYN